jgi:hypothetical protein
MSNYTVQIEVAATSNYIFPNTAYADVVVYPTYESQRLLFGTKSNVNAGMLLSSSNIAFTLQPSTSNSSFGFYTGNSNLVMTVLGTGKVGIGKAYPAYPLDIIGDLNFTGILRQNGAAYIGSQWSNNSSNIFINSSNVGIGKSNPEYPLDVAGIINASGMYINGNPLSTSTGGGFSASNTNTAYSMCNVGIGKSNPAYPLDVAGTVNASAVFINGNPLSTTTGGGFTASNSNTAFTTCNVGIGTTSPAQMLHVAGSVRVDSNLYLSQTVSMGGLYITRNNGGNTNITATVASIPGYTFTSNNSNVGIGTTTPQYALDVAGTVRGTTSVISPVLQSTGGPIQLLSEFDIHYKADHDGNNSGAQHVFYSSSNEKMRINPAGDVGIGTSTPSYTLDVNGSCRVTGGIALGTSNSGNYFIDNLSTTASPTTIMGYYTSKFTSATGVFQVYNNSTDRNMLFCVNSAGTSNGVNGVGINTSTPTYTLDVNGTINATTYNNLPATANYTTFSNWVSPLASAALPTATYNAFSNWASPLASAALPSTTHTTFSNWVSPLARSGFSATNANTAYTMCNIGIGKSDPTCALDVVGAVRATTGVVSSVFQSTTGVFQNTTGPIQLTSEFDIQYKADNDGNNSGAQHVFYSSSNEKMRINTAGDVGIGTSTPSYTLDVNGSCRVTGGIALGTSNSGNYFIDNISTTAAPATIMGYNTSKFTSATGVLQVYNNSTDRNMLFCVNSAGTSNGVNGVGINTSTPAYTLDVNGTINATTYNNLPATANYTTFSNWVSPLASAALSSTTHSTFSNWVSPLASAALPTSTYSTFSNWVSPLAKSGFSLSGSTASTGCNVQITGSATIMNGNNGNEFVGSQIKLGYGSTANYQHAIKTRHNAGANDTNNAIDMFVWQTSDASTAAGTKQVMSVTSAGVGINTSTPAYALDVNGTINATNANFSNLTLASAINGWTMKNSSITWPSAGDYSRTQLEIKSGDYSNFTFGYGSTIRSYDGYGTTGGTFPLYLQASSIGTSCSMGVNTISPSYTLDVNGSCRVTGGIALGNSSSGNYFIDNISTTAAPATIMGFNTSKFASATGVLQVYNNSTDRNMLFAINSAGTSSGTNSVSINTTLDVNGTTRITGGAIVSSHYHLYATGAAVGSSVATGPGSTSVTWSNVSCSGFSDPGATFTTITAPVSGLYAFNASGLQVGAGHIESITVVKSTSNIAYWPRPCLNGGSTVDWNGTYTTGLSATTFMNANDTIKLQYNFDGSGTAAGVYNFGANALLSLTLIQRTA